MQRTLATVATTLLAAALVAAAAAAFIVLGGLYDVGATVQHTQPVYSLLETAMKQSVRVRAAGITPPALPAALTLQRGAACYRDQCVQCHGAPGIAPGPVGMSMLPLPGPLLDAGRHWHLRELYWITRHGIRMTGMPSWGMRLSDQDIWAVAGFVEQMPRWSPQDYAAHVENAAMVDCALPTRAAGATAAPPADLSPDRQTRLVLRQYACVSCHRIPGMTGSDVHVGPPLEGLARRALIAGRLPNTPEHLVQWIRTPQAVKPGTAMPDLGVSEEHARLMAAYLSRLY
ncbi:c-type cytochrome [Hydrogenophaga pseudoflava]|uniref:c-type cytochrome n=1 Tax=Hydrogenophaga pseudoflava TaxID=47421 RepID=UPI0027E5066C|nr:c-type cytochrome [Hydrogenophaga pseudoflava]MDQ7746757.1 c-type cytochrome [Hydrogenophaga pseudoflava]